LIKLVLAGFSRKAEAGLDMTAEQI